METILGGGTFMFRRLHLPLFKKVNVSTAKHYCDDDITMRRHDITQYTQNLKDYQIEVSRLPDLSPTESDARQNAINVARIVAENHRLRALFLETKTLPIHQLVKHASVCKDVIENYPQYITAMTVLFLRDYPHLTNCLRLDREPNHTG